MNRKDLFNRQYPAPFDSYVYPIYRRFLDLKDEIIKNWKTEVINGMMAERGYSDLTDVRTSITKNGTFIIRLVPSLGFDTQDELKFYTDFFKAYVQINGEIIGLISDYWAQRDRQLIIDGYFNGAPDKTAYKPFRQRWEVEHKDQLYKLIITLKTMVAMMYQEKLKPEDLYQFTNVIDDEQGDFVVQMNALIQDSGLGAGISSEFAEGKADFYQYPDSDIVQSFWNYSLVHMNKVMADIHDKMMDSGYDFSVRYLAEQASRETQKAALVSDGKPKPDEG